MEYLTFFFPCWVFEIRCMFYTYQYISMRTSRVSDAQQPHTAAQSYNLSNILLLYCLWFHERRAKHSKGTQKSFRADVRSYHLHFDMTEEVNPNKCRSQLASHKRFVSNYPEWKQSLVHVRPGGHVSFAVAWGVRLPSPFILSWPSLPLYSDLTTWEEDRLCAQYNSYPFFI